MIKNLLYLIKKSNFINNTGNNKILIGLKWACLEELIKMIEFKKYYLFFNLYSNFFLSLPLV